MREMEQSCRKKDVVGALIGVPVQVVNELVRLWDHDDQSFRALAAEWLELNRAAAPTAPAATTGAQP